MGYELICNRVPRPLVCLLDLSGEERAEFDYVDDDYSARFVRYKGSIYDVLDTQRIEPDTGRAHPIGWGMRVHPGEPLARFDCIISESFFSGVVFAYADSDFETVIVGRYFA